MTFPLTFWDISLLLAVSSVVLLVTSELLSLHYGRIGAKINRKKLKNAAIVFSILFLITVAVRIASILINP